MNATVTASVEDLLADPNLRPSGGWSTRAEAWTDFNHRDPWRDGETAWRERVRRLEAELDAELLFAALEGERARARRLEAELRQLRERKAA